MITSYLSAFLLTFLISSLLTPVVRRLALRYNFVYKPKKDRWNRRVIPICGGVAIFLSFLLSFLLFCRRDALSLPLLAGACTAFFGGLIDDSFGIKPYSKLFVQIIIALFMYLSGISFKIFPIAFFNFFLTIFWFVAVMNAFNLLDNMDGLCAGIAVISSGLVFAYYGFRIDNYMATLALLVCAASLGFLRYNFYPAKIFMGDCGSMFIGFILAAIGVMGTRRGTSSFLATLAVPVLVLGVPVFDTILVTLTRRANGRHFYEGGKDHISHRLVILGMSERRAVLTLYFMSLGCGMVAFMYTKLKIAAQSILLASVVLAMVFFGLFLSKIRIYSSNREIRNNGKNLFLGGMIYYKEKMFEMTIDFIVISMSYIASYLLRYDGVISQVNLDLIINSLPILMIIKLSSFYWFGLYKAVWQYVGLHDLFNIFKAVTFGCIMSIISLVFMFRIEGYSRAVFIIDWLILLIAVSGSRLAMRLLREYFSFISSRGKKILIMGAGDAGEYLLRGLRYNKKLNYKPIGFLDDDLQKQGRRIHGVPILGTRQDIARLMKKYDVSEVLIAIPSLDELSFEEILKICQRNNIGCKKMAELVLW